MRDNTKNLGEFAISGGPGRPRGGRRLTLEKLDEMLAKAGNLEKFEEALQEGFDKDPLGFWKTYVFPLLPQKLVLTDSFGEDDYRSFTDKELLDRFNYLYDELNGNSKTDLSKS